MIRTKTPNLLFTITYWFLVCSCSHPDKFNMATNQARNKFFPVACSISWTRDSINGVVINGLHWTVVSEFGTPSSPKWRICISECTKLAKTQHLGENTVCLRPPEGYPWRAKRKPQEKVPPDRLAYCRPRSLSCVPNRIRGRELAHPS